MPRNKSTISTYLFFHDKPTMLTSYRFHGNSRWLLYDVKRILSDISSFSKRLTDVGSPFASFPKRLTDVGSPFASFSKRLTDVGSPFASFSKRLDYNQQIGELVRIFYQVSIHFYPMLFKELDLPLSAYNDIINVVLAKRDIFSTAANRTIPPKIASSPFMKYYLNNLPNICFDVYALSSDIFSEEVLDIIANKNDKLDKIYEKGTFGIYIFCDDSREWIRLIN